MLLEIIGDPRFPEGTAWKRHRFEPNQVIVREGERGNSLFFIEAGEVRVSGRVELEAHRLVQPGICDLGKGDIFGELCLYHSSTRTASVITISAASVLELDGQRLSIYLDAHPVQGYLFLKTLFETLSARLGRANKRVENLFAWGLKVHGIEENL
jgi:CRP-like cAMP-binding protein